MWKQGYITIDGHTFRWEAKVYEQGSIFGMWNSHVVSLVPFPLHPHMLRHTYATTLYRARVDLRTAQKLMGHSSIQVTADIYTHLEQEDSLHVADKLNEYLSGKSENSVKSSQKVVKLAI